jgi:hypothetical protein
VGFFAAESFPVTVRLEMSCPCEGVSVWSRKELLLGVVILLVMPALLACADPGWLFPPPAIDSWIYLGFFRHYPEYQSTTFPGTYYGSRLSWVVPGYCAHQILPPVAANCVLHLSVYFVALLSLFEALRHTTSPRAALLAALTLAGHSPFLDAVGWDYVDGVGLAYYLLTWALLVRAARSTAPRLWLIGAGGGAAGAFYANLAWLPLLGLCLPGYIVLRRRWHGERIWSIAKSQIGLMLSGFAALSVCLGAVNKLAGGAFTFFLPSLQHVARTTGQTNPWFVPCSVWLPLAYWIIWPAATVLACVLYAARRQRGPGDTVSGYWWPVNFLVIGLMFLLAELRGNPLLQLNYYASYLIGPLMLAFGTVLATPLAGLSRPAFGAALGLVAAGAVLHVGGAVPVNLTVALVGTLVGLTGLGAQLRAQWGVLACLALTSGASAFLPFQSAWPYHADFRPTSLAERINLYSRVTATAQQVDDLAQTQQALAGRTKVWFWYDSKEALGNEYKSLAAIWLWAYSLINDRFPIWSDPKGWTLCPGDLVIVPSQDREVVSRALASGRNHPLALRLLGTRSVGEGETRYTLAVFVLEPAR